MKIPMLVRIVKMEFEAAKIDTFKALFEEHKLKIRNVAGCAFLELYQDLNNKAVFFTYSYWNDESDLENYRNSELFKNIWSATKKNFSAKPEAWSVHKLVSLK
jgi:quinol monooxygenase YgiN